MPEFTTRTPALIDDNDRDSGDHRTIQAGGAR
ncbi:hypothetical protein K353_02487 [Kitasatospora sp. SolWspMP-SS2h]|nr:hypothetical protein K353_02487 [Kitasatospora sp. SolWspMP-SS2h]